MTQPARRHWFASRKLRWLALLLAVGAIAYFVVPWLLMPADLRCMQGTWKYVRVLENGKETSNPAQLLVISGSRGSTGREWYRFNVVPERRELVVFQEEELQILGINLHWPAWLRAPLLPQTMNYEITATGLVLRVQREGYECIGFLERP